MRMFESLSKLKLHIILGMFDMIMDRVEVSLYISFVDFIMWLVIVAVQYVGCRS